MKIRIKSEQLYNGQVNYYPQVRLKFHEKNPEMLTDGRLHLLVTFLLVAIIFTGGLFIFPILYFVFIGKWYGVSRDIDMPANPAMPLAKPITFCEAKYGWRSHHQSSVNEVVIRLRQMNAQQERDRQYKKWARVKTTSYIYVNGDDTANP